MNAVARHVYIISDLHLGGRPSSATDRGFQMMTHPEVLAAFIRGLAGNQARPIELVIAGDFVDFLAEEGEQPGTWTPLIDKPARAVTVLRRMVTEPERRLGPVFAALGTLVASGHTLTLLLGNHDIELSYPSVRQELARLMSVRLGHGFQFIYDGEAYRVGDALIEHGNRYDPFNVVDYDRLRRRRSLQSRGQEEARDDGFSPPVGSRLVAQIMNPAKASYAFVDILKPETQTVIPLLLALEPSLRGKIGKLLKTLAPAVTHGTFPGQPDVPLRLADAAANAGGVSLDLHVASQRAFGVLPASNPLAALLGEVLGGREDAAHFLADIEAAELGDMQAAPIADASAHGRRFLSGMWSLLWARQAQPIAARLPALHKALQVLQKEDCFRLEKETTAAYQRAAEGLCERCDLRYVVFGHSHLAREVDLGGGRTYLNTGTWANLLRIPQAILSDGVHGREALARWVDDLRDNCLDIFFRPTYARLDLDAADHVLEAHTLEVNDSDLALK